MFSQVMENGIPWEMAAWMLCQRWSITMAEYIGFQMLSPI